MTSHWTPSESGAQVLGLRLAPLTIGHVYLLAELRSPIVTGEDGADPIGELGLACIACASDVATARRDIQQLLGGTGWRARRAARRWAKHCAQMDFAAEAEKFRTWFAEQVSGPRQKRDTASESGHAISAPWWINLTANLCGEFGWRDDYAMTLTVRHAKQLISARLECNSGVQFTTAADERFRSAVDHWRDDMKRRGITSITDYQAVLIAESQGTDAQRN